MLRFGPLSFGELTKGIWADAHERLRLLHRFGKRWIVRREVQSVLSLDDEELVSLFYIEVVPGRVGQNHTKRIVDVTDLQDVRHYIEARDQYVLEWTF